MKLTSSAPARRRTASAPLRSFGGPQIPSPVRRMAPKPRRYTESSPPSVTSPANPAEMCLLFMIRWSSLTIFTGAVATCSPLCGGRPVQEEIACMDAADCDSTLVSKYGHLKRKLFLRLERNEFQQRIVSYPSSVTWHAECC